MTEGQGSFDELLMQQRLVSIKADSCELERAVGDVGRALRRTQEQILDGWITANPEAYAGIVWLADRDAAAGLRGSIGYYAELLRRPRDWPAGLRTIMSRGVTRPEGHVYVINNSIRALLVRRIAAEHPRIADVFETRRSKADPVGAASTWQGVGHAAL